jgi:hypothetical protein
MDFRRLHGKKLLPREISPEISTGLPQATGRNVGALSAPEQLDIFIPLHRAARLQEWASLAREQGLDERTPTSVSAFADWLERNGHAPAGVSHDAVELLVAVMHDYGRPAAPR